MILLAQSPILYLVLCIMLPLKSEENQKMKKKGSFNTYWLISVIQKQNNVIEIALPTVNSITTTTVITAHIAFFPIPLNNGSIRNNKETSVKAMPTLKACTTLLGFSLPTFHVALQAKPGNLFTLSAKQTYLIFQEHLSLQISVSAIETFKSCISFNFWAEGWLMFQLWSRVA